MPQPLSKGYSSEIFKSDKKHTNRVLVGIPMTGLLRSEWVIARYGQVIPCNWSQTDCYHWIRTFSPLEFLVADARNIIVDSMVKKDFEWLFFIDHDVIIPPDTVLKMNERMIAGDIPVWSGLYFTKSVPSEPLVYRGRGNGYYNKWKIGDEVWVDGLPMGCTMIHNSLLKVMWEEAEEYTIRDAANQEQTIRKVFATPAIAWYDPQSHSWFTATGTEDLRWCDQVREKNIFKKAGWHEFQRKRYPFLIDTKIFCRHIEFDGIQYPSMNEEREFMPNGS
jgi:hypothetical protein